MDQWNCRSLEKIFDEVIDNFVLRKDSLECRDGVRGLYRGLMNVFCQLFVVRLPGELTQCSSSYLHSRLRQWTVRRRGLLRLRGRRSIRGIDILEECAEAGDGCVSEAGDSSTDKRLEVSDTVT